MNGSTVTKIGIYKRLANLEQQVQRLKVQAYFKLPKKEQTISFYSEGSINKAVKAVRSKIWQKKYAKKIKRLS